MFVEICESMSRSTSCSNGTSYKIQNQITEHEIISQQIEYTLVKHKAAAKSCTSLHRQTNTLQDFKQDNQRIVLKILVQNSTELHCIMICYTVLCGAALIYIAILCNFLQI
jgi:hypothetical protein